ncbi:LANO_0H21044g1_1 [Lachancea nothofagi CBS 11611]|uniref:LANO_0H21044g1_1 n=1 Tax=Lachancea nothofagi CBS 11611 TaxID=1266666 RepID=A0A1G4KNK4_9SACH|nr:LANO_0H21044g1_1 [Lachancea nothofagi CBS 11611]
MDHPEFSKGLEKENQLSLIERSSLKPLYISTISIDGDNKANPLSDAVYKSVLDPVLSQPLQTLDQSLKNFSEIKRKLIHTGLFRDVKVSLDKETSGLGLKNLPEEAIRDYSLESPISTVARIQLTPMQFNNMSVTSTTSDSLSAFGGRYSFINSLGRAEVLTLQSELKFTPFQGKVDEKTFEAKLMAPLQKNPSLKAVIDANFAKVDLRNKNFVEPENRTQQNQGSLHIGVQKHWFNSKIKSTPVLYNGLSIVARNLKDPNSSANLESPLTKNSIVSHFLFDNRKFFGLFPASGVKFSVNNEYVISQDLTKHTKTTGGREESFDKLALAVEAQRPFFKNKVVNSLDFACGGIFPTAESSGLVHHMDKFYLGGLASLKGFERNSVGQYGGNYFYKLRVASSFKLPNTPADSPLRLQFFLNGGDVSNGMSTKNLSYAASSGVSLLYKSSLANMDLTYALPITNRSQDIAKPGFSFGVSLSVY